MKIVVLFPRCTLEPGMDRTLTSIRYATEGRVMFNAAVLGPPIREAFTC